MLYFKNNPQNFPSRKTGFALKWYRSSRPSAWKNWPKSVDNLCQNKELLVPPKILQQESKVLACMYMINSSNALLTSAEEL